MSKIIFFKENYFKTIPDFFSIETSKKFGSKRKYGNIDTYHGGEDHNSTNYKNQELYNIFYGIVDEISMIDNTYHGKFVIIKCNFKDIGGIDDDFFVMYKHLHCVNMSVDVGNIVVPGQKIGFMGNTGYCKTWDNNLNYWRLLTQAEKDDPECMRGVHIHFECQQGAKSQTPLLKELRKRKLLSDVHIDYFYRRFRLYINPNVLIDYAKITQEAYNENN